MKIKPNKISWFRNIAIVLGTLYFVSIPMDGIAQKTKKKQIKTQEEHELEESESNEPELSAYQEFMIIPKKVLKQINAQEIRLDLHNEDGIFIAKNKKTGLWGMFVYSEESPIKQVIPMNYDSVDFFEVNKPITGVWKKGKVGFYQASWSNDNAKEIIPCLYDDYKIFGLSNPYYQYYLAVKKNGLWAWLNWETGQLETDFLYDLSIGKMPFPNFEQ